MAKTLYVGVGGIGCRLLKSLAEKDGGKSGFLYFDTDIASEKMYSASDKVFFFRDYPYGTGCLRSMGQDIFRTYLYTGRIPVTPDGFDCQDTLLIRLVTTAFGGFGSAVVFELADYLSANIKQMTGGIWIEVQVIAFDVEQFSGLFSGSQSLTHAHRINTVDFINEFQYRSAKGTDFFPPVNLCLARLPGKSTPELADFVGLPFDRIMRYDVKNQYVKTAKAAGKTVFISYSTENIKTAEQIASAIRARGVGVWMAPDSLGTGAYADQIVRAIDNAGIFVVVLSQSAIRSPYVLTEINIAFERLRYGLIIMPLLIENTVLDGNFRFYLGAQEMFDCKTPPIEERINLLCDKIAQLVDEKD